MFSCVTGSWGFRTIRRFTTLPRTKARFIEEQATRDERQEAKEPSQLDLFTDYDFLAKEEQNKEQARQKERRIQEAIISIKHRIGNNAVLKGTSYAEGATAKDRNVQIGGHKA